MIGRGGGAGASDLLRLLRSPTLRVAAAQVLILGGVATLLLLLAVRTVERLEALGIHTGFGFLAHRAGFTIGQAPPLPVANAALIVMLVAVALGLIAAIAVARHANRRSRALCDHPPLLLGFAMALLLPSVLGWLLVGDQLAVTRVTADDSFGLALLVGAINTLRVAAIALVVSTLLGLLIALLRLSGNWLLERLGGLYVELVRNVPLLLHLFFWYFGVLQALPSVRESVAFGGGVFLNSRGLFVPAPSLTGDAAVCAVAAALGLIAALAYACAARRANRPHALPMVLLRALALALVPPALAWAIFGPPIELSMPELGRFNLQGGLQITPEFVTLVVALSVYHGAYNAEIIRSGILSVPRGQREAAVALGLPTVPTFWLVIVPQALRLIIPPLIGRYVGLIKSSSLAVAIGYPEIISIGQSITFATGQAIEVVCLTMLFYLTIDLGIALVMNRYNVRLQPPAAV